MCRAAFLPCPTAAVTVRSLGTMSPPAKIPGFPVIMFGATMTVPSDWNSIRGDLPEEAAVGYVHFIVACLSLRSLSEPSPTNS